MQQIYKLNLFQTVLKKNVKNMTIKQYQIKIVQPMHLYYSMTLNYFIVFVFTYSPTCKLFN